MTANTLNKARLHFRTVRAACKFAGRHGGRIAKKKDSKEAFWFGCGVTPCEIIAEAPIHGIDVFGTVSAMAHFID